MASPRTVRVQMLTRLSQPDSVAARNAADVLGEFHYVSSIPALSAALSNPVFSGEARAHMARGARADRAAGGGRAADGARCRRATAGPGGRAAGPAVDPGLPRRHARSSPLLGDGDAGVRAEAATTLGMFHDAARRGALVTALQNDASPIVRKQAAWALGEIHANAGAWPGPALQTAAANDASPFVRSLAAAALTRLSSR